VPFTTATFRFFRELARNNAKPWFEAHRADYEDHVRAPMRALIEEMDVRLARFAPEITGDPKRSLFRIYRDIRFSKDKSPYKTHAACWFYHRDGDARVGSDAEGGGAGFYFHRLRDALAEDWKGFDRVVRSPTFIRRFGGLDDEAVLKRMPRGFPETHPAARWLRYQSFTAGRQLRQAQAMGARLPALLETDFARLLPLVRWLNGALRLRSAVRR